MAWMAVVVSRNAVNMMTSVSGQRCLTWRSRFSPEHPGIVISMVIRCTSICCEPIDGGGGAGGLDAAIAGRAQPTRDQPAHGGLVVDDHDGRGSRGRGGDVGLVGHSVLYQLSAASKLRYGTASGRSFRRESALKPAAGLFAEKEKGTVVRAFGESAARTIASGWN